MCLEGLQVHVFVVSRILSYRSRDLYSVRRCMAIDLWIWFEIIVTEVTGSSHEIQELGLGACTRCALPRC